MKIYKMNTILFVLGAVVAAIATWALIVCQERVRDAAYDEGYAQGYAVATESRYAMTIDHDGTVVVADDVTVTLYEDGRASVTEKIDEGPRNIEPAL